MKTFSCFIQLTILLLLAPMLWAQEIKVKGHVTDTDGRDIPGAYVVYKGTTIGTITNSSGEFSLPYEPAGNDTLVFSFIGYETQEVKLKEDEQFVKIVLKEKKHVLDELVVVGYGTQKKADLTGSVSSVKMDELTSVPVSGVDQALQGLAAGVTVSQVTGMPGEGVSVRIRGVGSIYSGNSPLYIVDGVPTEDAMNTISSTDIESISILKDASAAAIYGSRANNGVVLITTKKGKAGKSTFSFNVLTGVQVHGPLTKMCNKWEYQEIYNEAADNDNENVTSESLKRDLIPDSLIEASPDINYLEEIFRPAILQNYSLNYSGGDEKTQYSLSGSYYNQEGILLNSDYDRFSMGASLTTQAEKWLKIGADLNLAKTENNIVGSSGDGYGGNGGSAVRYAYFRCPTLPIYDENGDYYDLPDYSEFFGDGYNPVGLLKNTSNKKNLYRFFGDINATIKFTNNFNFVSRFGYDHYSYNQRRFNKTWGTNDRINSPNSLTVSDETFKNWNWNNVFNYNLDIADNHFSFMAGSEALSEKEYENSTTEKDFADQDESVVYLGNGEGTTTSSESESGYELLSFFGRVNYNFNNKYFFSGVIREDGSSRFAKGNRWGTFYSGSFGWRIDRESFMQNLPLISLWKLRCGVGSIGNQDIENYAYYDRISSGYNYPFGGTSQDGYALSSYGNKNVKWETSNQYNIGTDVGFLENKLNLTLDYYIKITKNMLTEETLPTSAGDAEAAWVNDGKISNKGLEVEISYKEKIGDFQYNIDANFATLKNKVLELSTPVTGGRIDNGVYATKTEEGYPVGSFYLYKMEGIFQNESKIVTHANQGDDIVPGDVMYKDEDGSGTIDSDDRVHVGSAIPKYTVGLNLGVQYKNFDCSAFFQGAFGQKIYWQVATDIEGFYRAFNVTKRYYNNRWTGEGTSNTQPRASWDDESNNCKPSTRFLEDGSYLRLKSLQVGYTVPNKIAQKLFVKKCRIYFSGMNLYTWTKYPGLDPEMTTSDNSTDEGDRAAGIDWGTYPSSISYNLGLQLTF